MSRIVFEDWFENTLTSNLPKERKVVVVMDSVKYHCRFIEKAPTMKMKKGEMIAIMSKHDIKIANAIPAKSPLLEKILIILKNIEKQYVIDCMTEKAHYSVLRLPPYHCILNPIELVWNQLKYLVVHLSIYTSKPSKVLDLIQYICKEDVPLKIGIKEEEKFGIMDHILNNKIEIFIIQSSENDDVNDSWDEM